MLPTIGVAKSSPGPDFVEWSEFSITAADGERRAYHPGYYAAFVLDPDGNSVELGNHNRT